MYRHQTEKKDPLMGLLLVSLLLLSTLIVSSVTIFIAERTYHNPFYFFNRHLLHLALACISFSMGYLVRPSTWVRYRVLLLFMAFALLAVVLVPGIGTVINGSRRWIRLPLMTIQTSDPAKLLFILFTSAYCAEKFGNKLSFLQKWIPLISLLSLFAGLLLLQPDFGSAIVIAGVILQILFIAGMPILSFLMIIAAASMQAILLAVFTPYRFMRIISFLDPWLFPYSAGYQLTQSLMAIGRGGLWGVGLGNSLQKIFYLPEAHTDFIFAVFCEEIGAIGGVLVMGAFCLIVIRLMRWSYRFYTESDYFKSFYMSGLAAWIGFQFLVSAGVNMGLLPTKGISMPLLSYGGTHVLTSLFAFGIAFRCLHDQPR